MARLNWEKANRQDRFEKARREHLPPTDNQLGYIKVLAARQGEDFTLADLKSMIKTRKEASLVISDLS